MKSGGIPISVGGVVGGPWAPAAGIGGGALAGEAGVPPAFAAWPTWWVIGLFCGSG